MDTTWNPPLWQQLGAAIDMLENALLACPDELWSDRSRNLILRQETECLLSVHPAPGLEQEQDRDESAGRGAGVAIAGDALRRFAPSQARSQRLRRPNRPRPSLASRPTT